MYMNLLTFLSLKIPVLNFLNFLSSRAQLSYLKTRVPHVISLNFVISLNVPTPLSWHRRVPKSS